MSEYVTVRVRVNVVPRRKEDPAAVAVEMVKDALVSRPEKWLLSTFVSDGDVQAEEDTR